MQYCTLRNGRASAGKEQAVSYKKLGKRIQHAREEAGLSQEQLAAILGCSQPTLSNYEKGKSRIYLTQLQKVSEILNRPVQYFLEAMEPSEESEAKRMQRRLAVLIWKKLPHIWTKTSYPF
jgi:transcriptional regulator with XRE-family HTH domain